MKKKVLVLSVILTLLFSGVVVAASMYGEFEGYPIVKVKSNGMTLIEEGTPAVSWNGRVMVPIYMLRQLGADVSWDQQTQSVNVNFSATSSGSFNDINNLKFYTKVMDEYNKLRILGDLVTGLSESLSLAYNAILLDYQVENRLNASNNDINGVVESYNHTLNVVNSLYKEAITYNINLNSMDTILNGYYDAIEEYKKAYTALENYYKYNVQEYYGQYFSASKNGFDIAFSAKLKASLEYDIFYNLIQNY